MLYSSAADPGVINDLQWGELDKQTNGAEPGDKKDGGKKINVIAGCNANAVFLGMASQYHTTPILQDVAHFMMKGSFIPSRINCLTSILEDAARVTVSFALSQISSL